MKLDAPQCDLWTRRRVIHTAAAAAAGLAFPATRSASALSNNGWIDAHSHIWTPDTKRYPLAGEITSEDLKPPSFTAEELLAVARSENVNRVVLISHFRYYGYDNRYLIDSAKRYPGVFAVVAALDFTKPAIAERMRTLKEQSVTGYRIRPDRFSDGPDPRWLQHPGMQEMWRVAAAEGIAMCPLIKPDSLTTIGPMCRSFPDTTVVIDHFGRVGNDTENELQLLVNLARYPNVHVKVSAFYAHGAGKPPYLDLAPKIRRLLDAYGPERLMWASDCPYQLNGDNTYRDSIALIRNRLDYLSDSDRDWILRKTAENVYFSGIRAA